MIYAIIVIIWLGLIYYFGTSSFGRGQTQKIIDRYKGNPRVWQFLDKNHGTLRASFHYVEFGGLYFLIYFALTGGVFRWRYDFGFIDLGITFVLAYVDEVHQSRTAGRCFRRIDLLHSYFGGALAFLVTFLVGR